MNFWLLQIGSAVGGYESTVRAAMKEHGYEHPTTGIKKPSDTFTACVNVMEKINQMMKKVTIKKPSIFFTFPFYTNKRIKVSFLKQVREQDGDNAIVRIYTLGDENRVTIKDCLDWMKDLTGVYLFNIVYITHYGVT